MLIFVAHPYRGNVAHNLSEMRRLCAELAEIGDIPICPALYCTQFLDDNDTEQRELGMAIGARMMELCNIVRVYGYSAGVKQEIALALRLGIPVEYASVDEDMALD